MWSFSLINYVINSFNKNCLGIILKTELYCKKYFKRKRTVRKENKTNLVVWLIILWMYQRNQQQNHKVLRNMLNAAWYVYKKDIHQDLGIPLVSKHINADNWNLIYRLKTIMYFKLVCSTCLNAKYCLCECLVFFW